VLNPRATIVLTNGTEVRIPAHLIQGLDSARDEDRAAVVVQGGGYGLHWPSVDLDHSIPGLLAGVFGTRSFMAKLAGKTKSSAKAAAARKNGRRGGRPRKPKAAA
jgi:hypothetical protein